MAGEEYTSATVVKRMHITTLFQGVSLHVDTIDRDNATTFNYIDELVDVFLVPLSPPDIMAGANATTPQQYSGRFGFATIELSFQLECLPGFVGEECLNSTVICDPSSCDNGGVCSRDETDGFTCISTATLTSTTRGNNNVVVVVGAVCGVVTITMIIAVLFLAVKWRAAANLKAQAREGNHIIRWMIDFREQHSYRCMSKFQTATPGQLAQQLLMKISHFMTT